MARSDYTSSIAQKVRFAHIESNKKIDKKKTTKCEFNLLTGSGGKMRLCITVYSIAHSCGDRIMGETYLRETEFTWLVKSKQQLRKSEKTLARALTSCDAETWLTTVNHVLMVTCIFVKYISGLTWSVSLTLHDQKQLSICCFNARSDKMQQWTRLSQKNDFQWREAGHSKQHMNAALNWQIVGTYFLFGGQKIQSSKHKSFHFRAKVLFFSGQNCKVFAGVWMGIWPPVHLRVWNEELLRWLYLF